MYDDIILLKIVKNKKLKKIQSSKKKKIQSSKKNSEL